MLVLSRRQGQRIFFPTLATTIEVVRLQGNTVRLGIQAPDDVPVFREEIAGSVDVSPREPQRVDSKLEHLLRNQLHATDVGLAVLRGQIAQGRLADAADTIDRLRQEEARLRDRLDSLATPPDHPEARSRTALVVEDNANERELLATFLRMNGFKVVTAGDGADALDYLASRDRPDVMLLDMMMPRCDGPTTVRRIRSTPSLAGLKIFAVSGAGSSDLGMRRDQVGVDGWFAKPVDVDYLARTIRNECDSARDGRPAPCRVSVDD